VDSKVMGYYRLWVITVWVISGLTVVGFPWLYKYITITIKALASLTLAIECHDGA
jgi:hypothetical protein